VAGKPAPIPAPEGKKTMKRLIYATLSLSLLGSTAALAQPYPGPQHGSMDHGPSDHAPMGHQAGGHQAGGYNSGHQWRRGDRFTGQRHVVSNWNSYHLHQPPHGYEWVQDGSQFVMVAVATGVIADVLLNSR
jgi:Ni/Co efflux regulator RcnB